MCSMNKILHNAFYLEYTYSFVDNKNDYKNNHWKKNIAIDHHIFSCRFVSLVLIVHDFAKKKKEKDRRNEYIWL